MKFDYKKIWQIVEMDPTLFTEIAEHVITKPPLMSDASKVAAGKMTAAEFIGAHPQDVAQIGFIVFQRLMANPNLLTLVVSAIS